MKLMKIISWIIKGVILLLLLIVAFLNTQNVQFTYLPEQSTQLPLIVIVFGGFVVGAVFGLFAMFGRLLRLRSENNRLRNEVQKSARLTTEAISAPVAKPAVSNNKVTK
ncbi:hypothetical protein HMPREF9021_00795 [Simonsiella muelleri ATCC 29453]|uniref:Lipopolysaccharide assembly protein A domain-containing protein n=2 Tax=Simonsiella TaxID=71 RepID=V9H987_9NEIS|nr:hypothetical protein HMPREF9021_00795 [Simonsiella muelleri ATCC 29453]